MDELPSMQPEELDGLAWGNGARGADARPQQAHDFDVFALDLLGLDDDLELPDVGPAMGCSPAPPQSNVQAPRPLRPKRLSAAEQSKSMTQFVKLVRTVALRARAERCGLMGGCEGCYRGMH